MNTDKIIKESRIILIISVILGTILFGMGIVFNIMEVNFIANTKSIIGLSFIPFSLALVYYFKISRIKKSPQKMINIITSENDERLIALKNGADSQAFRIIQASIFLSYMGYTLIVPQDIFESVGWWILMMLMLITFISQGLLTAKALKVPKNDDYEINNDNMIL